MKRLFSILLVLLLSLSLIVTSCGDDDDDNTPDPTDQEAIVGTWLSEGANLAPLLANLGFTKIEAIFDDDNTYLVKATVTGGNVNEMTGTYTVQTSGTGNIMNITLNQTTPAALTSQGIYEITNNNDNMRYEVVQTSPDIGATPPTATAGFGSTNGGALGIINIQNYVRVNE